jgi:pyruvate dehydrogenase E2 component (dihydrolipoamide acetyltransferase)
VNAVASASVAEASEDVIPAGPAVRRFAREVGVDLTGVNGSGEHGRITREDVLSIVRHQGQAANTKPAAGPSASAPVATVAESPAKAAASKGIE